MTKSEMKEKLHLDVMTVSGYPLGETLEGAEVYNSDVILPLSDPIYADGSLGVLGSNLAPDGCVSLPHVRSACGFMKARRLFLTAVRT